MKTIIVTTDFSPAADNAIDYAAGMAIYCHKELLLLYVNDIPISYSDIPFAGNLDEMNKLAIADMNTLKEKLTAAHGGILNITTEVHTGSFFDILKETCTRIQPYAVVMGSQGKSATERFLFGSHTVNAMKHLNWPLIAVPPHATFHTISKIGFACDLEDIANATPVNTIKTWIKDFNASLLVLNVGKQSVYNPDTVYESGLLTEMLKELNPGYEFITHSDIDKALTDFVKVNKIDLLIVLPKKHTSLEDIFHKSHTKQLALHSVVPVMALHSII